MVPLSICLFSRDCLDRSDDVLQLGDLTQSAAGWQPIVLGHRQDERALVRLQAFEEGVELVGHRRPLTVRVNLDNLTVSTPAPTSAIVGRWRLDAFRLP